MSSPAPERWADGPSILSSVWRHRWLVLVVTVVFGLAAYLLSSQQEPVYEASTQLYLTDPSTSDVFGQAGGTNLEGYVPQQVQRVTSTPVLTAAAEVLPGSTNLASLRRQLDVEGDPDVATLTITVEDGSPERAAAIANAVASAYQEEVRGAQLERAERAAAELENAQEEIEARIDDLGELGTDAGEAVDGQGSTTSQVQIGVLTQRLLEIDALTQQLRVDARLFGSGVEFVEEALPPNSPVAPTPLRTAAATAFLGALLASAAAYWLAGRSHRITTADDPARILGVPMLGTLPTYEVHEYASLRERALLDPRTAEAYRFAYTSLDLVLREIGARSVLITSATPGVGKTETALQLALTARSRDRAVLLVDGDVRMRGLTVHLRATRAPGLLDLAKGYDPTIVAPHWYADGQFLPVLTAGGSGSTGIDELREEWLSQVLPQLTAEHELTLIDSPPLLAVAETATLAAHTDAVVLVVREGSQLEDLERVKQRMRFVGQRIVGFIYLSPTALDSTDFDYGLVRAEAWRSGEVTRRPPPDLFDRPATAHGDDAVDGTRTGQPITEVDQRGGSTSSR
jgi:Mrp family chromosome partitioning ATPase/capsular polysaccharide biosynthesis protein